MATRWIRVGPAALPPRDTGIGGPRLVRKPATKDPFIEALLEDPSKHAQGRSPLDWAVSFLIHGAIIAALVMTPLYFTKTLDLRAFTTSFLLAPPPAPPPPAPPAPRVAVRNVPRLLQNGRLYAPTAVPRTINIVKVPPLPPDADGVTGGVIGGVPGGQPGGVLGGILGGAAGRAPSPPPPAAARIVRVGGNVKAPRRLYTPAPQYPIIARTAKVEGTVVIEAILDTHGNVVQAHAVRGSGLLVPAALAAVSTWRYEPTYLDGEPVAVEMRINVSFSLQ